MHAEHTMRRTKRIARTIVALFALGACAATVAQPAVAQTGGATAPHRAAHVSSIARWVPHIHRSILPTRTDVLGSQLATWYGPGFYGHGTACGGVLTPTTWGIAHRTLPCGTLVTISNGSRTVTVPVIDRGPYSGANIDLTSQTSRYLGFVSGSVRMTAVRRYRLVPLPAPVAGIVALQ